MNKQGITFTILALLIAISHISHAQPAGDPPAEQLALIKQEEITFDCNGVKMKGFIAYIPDSTQKKPAVLIVPEWWGYGEYVKMRARMLASLGYVAMAVDMYGDGKIATTPDEAIALSGEFYKNPSLGTKRLQAAERQIRTLPQVDAKRIAAIGYCFGGSMVLNAAKMGMDFKGVVSFHGSLKGGVPAVKGSVRSRILICHGAKDGTMTKEDVMAFRHNLDSAGVIYTFKVYPDATHAFSNPAATALGAKFNMPIAYNEEADKKSWNDMKVFLHDVLRAK